MALPTDGDRFFKGFVMLGVTLSVTQAAAPYLETISNHTGQYLMLAMLMMAAFGLFLMATSQPVIDLLVTIEEIANKSSDTEEDR